MTDGCDPKMCSKLLEIENITIPYDIEIPPFPIKFKEIHGNTKINLYGLPDGLSFDHDNLLLLGKPNSIGRHGVVISAVNEYGFDCIGFNINVMNYEAVPINIKPINNQTIQLGQPLETINVNCDDQSVNINVTGLPLGVDYDPFLERICGTPDLPGEYRVSIHACSKYGTEKIIKFIIFVEGVMNPSIELTTSIEEITSDKINHFHSINDQIIYTFTIKNTGNVTFTNIILEDIKLGHFKSNKKFIPNSQASFKYAYCITQDDIDKGVINTNTIASGETSNNIKLTTTSSPFRVTIRGHDNNSFHIKTIKTDFIPKTEMIKCVYMITNCGDYIINDIRMIDSNGVNLILDKNQLMPNQSIFGRLQCKSKHCSNNIIQITGQTSDHVIIGNTYQSIINVNDKNNVQIQLYSNHYHIKENQPIILVAQFQINKKKNKSKTPSPSGVIKFYDGIRYIGKSNICSEVAVLRVADLSNDVHVIHAIYQGDNYYHENGSDILTQFVGNEKTLSNEQLLYIKNHIVKFKKNEFKANNLIHSVSQENITNKTQHENH